MIEREVVIRNSLGLHARAAARFVRLAGRFQSHVKVERGGRRMDGKSILGMLLLAASRGTHLILLVDGPDEQEAAQALVELIESGLGEEVA